MAEVGGDRLFLAVCHHQAAELRRVLERGEHDDVRMIEVAARCSGPPLEASDLVPILDGVGADRLHVFGGACMARALEGLGPDRVDAVDLPMHCLERIADSSLISTWIAEGAYLVSPGWLGLWREQMADWGFDRPNGTAFFGEAATRVLLLDTGVDPDVEVRLEEFSSWVGLPAERILVGLGHFQRSVDDLVDRWRRERELAAADAERSRQAGRTSMYAVAFEAVGHLAAVAGEQQAVERILDLFMLLFAPLRLTWLPVVDGVPGALKVRSGPRPDDLDRARWMAGLDQDHAWTADGLGFVVRVARGDDVLGYVEAAAFAEDRASDYLNLALSLRSVCALAIANARTWDELQAARLQLSRQADSYRVLANAADGLVAVDADGVVRFANPVARELLAVDEGASMPVELAATTGAMLPLDVVDTDGQDRHVEARLQASVWEDGEVMVASLRDVTEQRRAEAALRQAQRLEELGRMAGGVAHDFNNVLLAASGSLELALAPDVDPAEVRRRVQAALYATERGSQLARRLLTFAKPAELRVEALELGAAIEQLLPLLRQVAGPGVSVGFVPAREPVWVEADGGELEQIVINLVANARDAMEGHGTLLIRLAVSPDGRATLSVQDDGCGMSAEVMDRIFEPFFTTKEAGRGTGLGLATVHGSVQRAEGELRVESAPGQGTRFEVLLPRTPEPDNGGEVDTLPGAIEAPLSARILVVDDEPTIRELLTTRLRLAGHEVRSAGSGVEALELLAPDPSWPDLLVTDLSMPIMDGAELAAAVRDQRPEIPVLFVSGLAEFSFELQGIDPDGVAVLPKPFRLSDAVLKVTEVLSGLDLPG